MSQIESSQVRLDLSRYLQYLLQTEPIENPGAGIIRQVIARGEHSLSPRQEAIYDRLVRQVFTNRYCSTCGEKMEPDDLLFLSENKGVCWSCANRRAKIMAE